MADVKEAPKAKTQNGPEQTKDILPRTSTAPLRSNGSPFTMMRRFAREMDHLFDDFGLESGWHLPRFLARGRELLGREAGFIPAEWSPRIDVLERDGQFTVRTDLPGMSRDDIKVEIVDGLLTIQGERTNEKKEEREGYSYSECSYGSFYRTIPLPEGADASKATADFRNGVLEVTVPAPARAESKARQVEVRETK
jgi:HSP20 family protein